jgi:hypothetical protein
MNDPAAVVYRTKPAALIAKPYAVWYLNWLLGLFDAGVLDKDTLDQFLRR